MAYAIATLLIEPIRAYLTTRALGIPLRRYLVSLSGIAQATAVMTVVILAVGAALTAAGAPAAARLPLLVLLGGGVYVAACLWRAPELAAELRGVVRAAARARASRRSPCLKGLAVRLGRPPQTLAQRP